MPRLKSSRGAVNTRLTTVTVHITLANVRRAVAKFSKSRVFDKVLEESTLIFRYLISLKHRPNAAYKGKEREGIWTGRQGKDGEVEGGEGKMDTDRGVEGS